MTETSKMVARAMSRLYLRLWMVRERAGASDDVLMRLIALALAWKEHELSVGPEPVAPKR